MYSFIHLNNLRLSQAKLRFKLGLISIIHIFIRKLAKICIHLKKFQNIVFIYSFIKKIAKISYSFIHSFKKLLKYHIHLFIHLWYFEISCNPTLPPLHSDSDSPKSGQNPHFLYLYPIMVIFGHNLYYFLNYDFLILFHKKIWLLFYQLVNGGKLRFHIWQNYLI